MEISESKELIIFDFKTYYKAAILMRVWYQHKDRQTEQNQDPQIDLTILVK